jgi:hypothetical protein
MPTILLKKSDTPGSVPGTANLTNLAGGVEVAVNTADKRVYSMTSASAVIELGTNPSSLTCSDVSATVLRAGSATITNLLATTLTVSGGTANGVLYLNGSKVATSGSALTFDGTDFKMPNGGSMLLGASASGASLLLINGTAAAQRLVLGTSGTDAVINATRTSGTSPNLLFQLEGANSMALTSTGLGIGTASPGAKLHVLGSNFVGIFAGTNANTVYTEYRYNSTTTSGLIGNGSSLLSAAADSDFIVRSEGALKFATNGNNFRAVIDTSGNLGLGVTPSAWGLGKAIEVGAAGNSIWSGAGYIDMTRNVAYTSGAYRYSANGTAARFEIDTSVFAWYTAPSWDGTGSNIISFTQALTLNSNGNLALQGGTTSASGVGVTFPASQSASTDANCLDDYEEGTWSPVITDTTNNATMAAGTFGRYTKVGRLVTCQIYVETTSLGSIAAGSGFYISGWPFSIDKSGGGCFSSGAGLNITANQNVTLYPWSATLMRFYKWDAATGTSAMVASEWSADGAGFVTVSYEV